MAEEHASCAQAICRRLRESGWQSKTVKQEIYDNFLRQLAGQKDLFPGIIGYEDTVIPEINLGLIAGHDMLFLGEKGQAKSRLMRNLVRFLDPRSRISICPRHPFHEDPLRPISQVARRFRCRAARSRDPDRLVAARGSVCRAACSRHQVRGYHRRNRSGQTGRRGSHVDRRGAAFRSDSANASRDLCDQRAAGTG